MMIKAAFKQIVCSGVAAYWTGWANAPNKSKFSIFVIVSQLFSSDFSKYGNANMAICPTPRPNNYSTATPLVCIYLMHNVYKQCSINDYIGLNTKEKIDIFKIFIYYIGQSLN